jgi:predicted dehydrogenase
MHARVGIVGLGHAGGLIVDALGCFPNVRIVAGVDPRPGAALVQLPPGIRLFHSVQEVPASLEFDIAVVATPTGTHVDICRELLAREPVPGRILCEKPMGARYQDVTSVLDQAATQSVRLEVLYHYAFAPEVVWMAERWSAIESDHGAVNRLSARFDDPKNELAKAAETLISSWADAGINALSVLARFVGLREVRWASGGAPAVCHAKVEYDSNDHVDEGSIETSWTAPEVFKATELGLADGTTYTLDHALGTVSALDANGSTPLYSVARTPPLPSIRYRTMLAAYLEDDDAVFDVALTRRLHRVLAEGFERNVAGPIET